MHVETSARQMRLALEKGQVLEAILANAQDAILLADDRGHYVDVSNSACDLTGYTKEELLGMTVEDLTPDEDRRQSDDAWAQFTTQGHLSGGYSIKRKDGVLVPVDYRAKANILPGLHLSVLRDVSEQARAWEAVGRSEQRLRAMIEASPISVQSFAPDGTSRSANAAWERLWDVPASAQEGYNVLEDRQFIDSGAMTHILAAFAGEARSIPAIRYDPAANGFPGTARWVVANVYPIFGPEGDVQEVILLLQDATARVEAERALESLNRDLERRVKERTDELQGAIAELEGFTYSVSHDLRAPLRSIMSSSMILIEDFAPNLPPAAITELKRQAGAAKKLGTLVDELLKLSRLARSEMQERPIDVSALAAEAAGEVNRDYGQVQFDIDEGLEAIGDHRLLKLVLFNLFDNAAKFSHGEGRVKFGLVDGAFFVKDEGIGFDSEYAGRLFLPFERLVRDSEFPGTGIGLANAQRIIKRHGGRIWAESAPGKGATFFFTLGDVPTAPGSNEVATESVQSDPATGPPG